VRDWFARYPFACLEQKTSKSMGLRDGKLWQGVAAQIPTYLDADGLASYFPPREGDGARGSDILTAYLLAATHEAASLNPAFALSDEVRAPMERGLIAFVEGRIQRNFWSPAAKTWTCASSPPSRRCRATARRRAACWAASPSRPTSGPPAR
jgi:hypothetical protein